MYRIARVGSGVMLQRPRATPLPIVAIDGGYLAGPMAMRFIGDTMVVRVARIGDLRFTRLP